MTKLIRYFSSDQTYFVTTVSAGRAPILVENIDLLRTAVNNSELKDNFVLLAWVVLPEHLHAVIKPRGSQLCDIIHRIKLSFGARFRQRRGMYRGKVWQDRYWDHVIRNQEDLNRHIDYIHYNPVKHGLVSDPSAWKSSSLQGYYRRGYYSRDWGVKSSRCFDGDFGE